MSGPRRRPTAELILFATAILLLGGIGALILSTKPRWASRVAVTATTLASLVGLFAVFSHIRPRGLELPWGLPFAAEATFYVDGVSATFLVPVFVLAPICALYGAAYLRRDEGQRALGAHWFFWCLLIASLVVVLIAEGTITFLVAWEVLSIASYFLITYRHDQVEARSAGWTYLIASHIGTAFLVVFLLLASHDSQGTLLLIPGPGDTAKPAALFLLALIGFGTKAGLFPLHVWLPEAYPAAPSHVSAFMSAAVTEVGLYGILRAIRMLVPVEQLPPLWWGIALVGVGCVSGLWGILFALPQRDLKRLLAYSSIEHIGIIAIGLGLGTLGWSMNAPSFAALSFGGAMLHLWNHAVFKGGLFMAAGAISHGTGSRDLERLGGLAKQMPKIGRYVLVLVLALVALPPLNGFAGELVLYLAALGGLRAQDPAAWLPAFAALGSLVAIGGFAAIAFAKAYGIAFLGASRSAEAAAATEPTRGIRGPILVTVWLCLGLGLASPWLFPALGRLVTERALGLYGGSVALAEAADVLRWVTFAGGALMLLLAVLVLVRRALLRGRDVRTGPTWGCGYAAPTARMQYTGASFVEPATTLFQPLLRVRREVVAPQGIFPREASLQSGSTILVRDALYGRAFTWIGQNLGRLRRLQHGNVHLYVLYVGLTLLALLIWRLS